MRIESLHRERIRERNGWSTGWVMIGARLSMNNGILCMNIFEAVPPSISSKELKTFKNVSEISNVIQYEFHLLSTSICALENSFSKGLS